jgi:hypothetical protein
MKGRFEKGISMSTTLGITINYTPPGSELDLTLAVLRDGVLLVEVLKSAIAEADQHAGSASDPVAAGGYRTQRDFLRKCLEDVTLEWAAAMTVKAKFLECRAMEPPAAVSELVQ